MAYQYKTLTRNNSEVTISLKADKQYFKLLGVFTKDIEASKLLHLNFDLKLKSNNNSHSFEEPILIGKDVVTKGKLDYLSVNYTPSRKLGNSVTILSEGLPEGLLELVLIYDIDNLSIPVTNPFKDFESHLKQSNNPRILFSAPFGHGKTTFVNLYFDEKQDDYEVFHIYPVNFSIAKNEDIFRYIKTELLYQLLSKDIEFEKVEVNSIQSITSFLGKNIHNVFAPFIRLLPAVGRNLYEIYKDLYSLVEKYGKDKEEQVSEEDLAIEFIKGVYEQEGSIYEDDFYTQLIRQLIEQLKKKGKTIVWVIDDLDRMDPDHIFRILNVLSAHVDDYNSEMLGLSNKFGFDKTILVADYNNLINIFNHKYGAGTDSRGYFDKFFSKDIYNYNNLEAIEGLINEYTYFGDDRVNSSADFYRLLLRMLLKSKNLSLRELIQLRSIGNSHLKRNFQEMDVYLPIYMLCKSFTIKEINAKLNDANGKFDDKSDYDNNYVNSVLAVLVLLSNTINNDGIKQYIVHFKDKEYKFQMQSYLRTIQVNYNTILINGNKPLNTIGIFSGKDFSDAVMLLFEKYKSNQVAIEKEFKRYFN